MEKQKPYTLLIVDDEQLIRETMSDYLEDSGFCVYQAENGRDALKMLESKPEIDLVITDLDMPVMGGLDLIRELNALSAQKATLIVSGHGDMDALIQALRLGAWNYISKPIEDLSFLEHAVLQGLEKLRLIRENAAQKITLEQKNFELAASLSRLKKAQQKLVQAEKMSALGRVVAGISHEISTPLGIGITAASFLEQKFQELFACDMSQKPLEQDKILHSINESMAMLQNNLHKTSELLGYFKQIAVESDFFEKRSFLLNPFLVQISSSYKRLLEEKKFTLRIECPLELQIESYPSAFLIILQHLIKNSLEHAFIPDHMGEIVLSASLSDTEFQLLYSDNGPGLAPDTESKIFEPFFTTSRSEGHSGLGLSIINNLVLNLLGGFIDFKNAPGKGLVFKITISLENSA